MDEMSEDKKRRLRVAAAGSNLVTPLDLTLLPRELFCLMPADSPRRFAAA
jgi:hypothetical protein